MATARGLSSRAGEMLGTLRMARHQAVIDHAFTDPAARERLDDLLADVKAALGKSPTSPALLEVLGDMSMTPLSAAVPTSLSPQRSTGCGASNPAARSPAGRPLNYVQPAVSPG